MARILVVDDEPMVRDFIELALVSVGYEVETCPNGLDALDRISKQCFDLAITDHLMPEMTGLQLAAAIRVKLPNLPIVLVTGDSSEVDIPTAARSFDFILEKPISIENLRETAARFTPRSKS